ncbi:UspA domain protein [Ammonifex degensii KC4]|uniref:UspA domain protein n=1 Tax=Ammonifex degensii (strain DSM 10501 / KC4) TaxID=429009 RepID=C9R8C6_AMMDK|nr:universal stress protein [Ammonifex degensii]ACX52555.1 UspA domain protein [Ammonifex degensii KC4]
MYKKILVAFDGSPYSQKALTAGIELARCCGSELHALTVVSLPEYAGTVGEVEEMVGKAQDFYRKKLEKASQQARAKGVELNVHLLFGHIGETIIRFAQEQECDLIIAGTRGWSPLQRLLMGSVSTYIVRHAPCAVLIEKGKEEDEND